MNVENKKINSLKSQPLEIIRGLAALTVIIGHTYTKIDGFPKNIVLTYALNMASEAVIIFFILSGFVIQLSQEKSNRKFKNFLFNRIVRIYPIYFLAVVMAIIVAFLKGYNISITNLFGNLFFLQTLQGYIVPVLPTNQALWSLSFEMFFYVVFAISLLNRWLINFWIALASVSVVLYNISFGIGYLDHLKVMFAFSFIWLLGCFAAKYRDRYKFENSFAISLIPLAFCFSRIHFIDNYYDIYRFIGFSILCLPLFNALTSNSKNVINIKGIIPYLIAIPIISLLWFHSKSNVEAKIFLSLCSVIFLLFQSYLEKLFFIFKNSYNFLIYVASISYSLYIIHMPILYGLNKYINIPVITGIFTVAISFILAHILELFFQPKVSVFIKNLFDIKKG